MIGELSAGLAAGLAALAGLAAGWLLIWVVERMVGPKTLSRAARTALVAITAAVFAAVGARFGIVWAVIVPLILAAALIALSAVDLCCYRLPDPITFGAFGVSLAAMAAVAPTVGGFGTLPPALGGAVGFGAVLWAVHEVSPRGLGFGDVKLGFVCGLHLGWTAGAFHTGWSPVVGLVAAALLMAGLAGVVGGLVVAWLRRRGHQVLPDPAAPPDTAPPAGPSTDRPGRFRRLVETSFPFGPALAAGTMTAVLFSDALVG